MKDPMTHRYVQHNVRKCTKPRWLRTKWPFTMLCTITILFYTLTHVIKQWNSTLETCHIHFMTRNYHTVIMQWQDSGSGTWSRCAECKYGTICASGSGLALFRHSRRPSHISVRPSEDKQFVCSQSHFRAHHMLCTNTINRHLSLVWDNVLTATWNTSCSTSS